MDFDSKSLKLAQQVAMRIEQDIVNSGWQVGELIGSEAELATRYGVSRWVIREAIRITEQDGLVEIRRGRFGGTAVSAPVLDVVGLSIRRFLAVSRISHSQLYEARSVLESFAARLAVQRLTAERRTSLLRLHEQVSNAKKEEHLHLNLQILLEVLRTADNAALEVFTFSLSQVTTDLALLRGISEDGWKRVASRLIKLRTTLLESILSGDDAKAKEMVRNSLDLSLDAYLKLSKGQRTPTLLSSHTSRFDAPAKTPRPKLADQISRQIEFDLITNDWEPGKILGSEAELMQRYNVSRSVIREAIRPLERLGAVQMCRGKSSGLKVTQPEPSAIVRSVVLYLSFSKNNDFVSYELCKEIELVVVSQLAKADEATRHGVATKLNAFSEKQFRPSLASQRQIVHFLGMLFAEHTTNLVFSFFLRILAEMVLISSRCTLSAKDAAMGIRSVQASALNLAKAIESSDENTAKLWIEKIWDALREAYDTPRKKNQSSKAA